MDKELPKATAVSLGTGIYNYNSSFQKVVFRCAALHTSPTCTRSKQFVDNPAVFGRDHPRQSINLSVSSSLWKNVENRFALSQWSDESVNRTTELWGLSCNDRTNLIELGMRLQDTGNHSKNNPADAVRFLIANSGDVTSAELKFRNMISWRHQHNVDKMLLHYHPPKLLVNHYPGAVLRGMDNEGDPIFLSRLGVTDTAGMLLQYGRSEMINHAIWLRELICTGKWIQEYEKIHKKPVKQALVIEDIHGIQILHILCNRPLLSLYAEIMRLDQDNYPEAAKKIIILRAPALFHIIWNVVQHFFDTNVREKMIFTTRNNYVDVLSQHLDISVLPPTIIPKLGKGVASDGMPSNFVGGRLPVQSVSEFGRGTETKY